MSEDKMLIDELADSKKFIKKPKKGGIVKVYFSRMLDLTNREHWQRYGKIVAVVLDKEFEGREVTLLNEIEKPDEKDIDYYLEEKKVQFNTDLSLKYDVCVRRAIDGKW